MSLDIQLFKEVTGRYPDTLTEAGLTGDLDPWGFAYRYLRIEGTKAKGARKDRLPGSAEL